VKHLSGNELRYGAGATPTPGVVYQPDVVVIGGGAGAVHAVSAAGLTWTIDANAPGANQLAVGKIMLATSLGTGRVLRLTKSGGDDVVVLGPVAITDVIRDADLGSATPIPIADTLAYTTPSAPGISVDASQDPSGTSGPPSSPGTGQPANTSSPTGTAGTRSHHQRRLAPADGGNALVAPAAIRALAAPADPTLPPPSSAPTTVAAGDFQVTPICCNELGINIGYKKGAGVLKATVKLNLSKPTFTFRLLISGGTLREATVQVHGASAVSVVIDAATSNSAGSIAGQDIKVPETLTIPLGVFGVPLVLTLSQSFHLSMQLLGAASLHTNGEYGVSGDLGFGYRNGGGPNPSEVKVDTQNPMTANTTVVGVASGAVRLGWNVKASIGIGVLGFGAGVWYEIGVGLGIVGNSSLSTLMPGCVIDAVVVDGRYGIGWWISPVVAKVINFFLNLVDVKPIAASGGPSWGPVALWRPAHGNYCP